MIKNILLASTFLIFIGQSSPLAFAAERDKIISEANSLYAKGKYEEALKLYEEALSKDPDAGLLNFNAGTAQFKTSSYQNATGSFQKGLVSENRDIESYSSYNLANTKYKTAKSFGESDLSASIKLMEEALSSLKRAIRLSPRDNDAKFNYELVNKELKELKEKLKQQPQQQQQSRQQQKKQQQDKQQQEQEKQQEQADKQEQQGQKEQEQKQQDQSRQQEQQQQDQQQEQDAGSGAQAENPQEMSAEEAKMLLEGFQQEEARQGKLEDTGKGKAQEVLKDW